MSYLKKGLTEQSASLICRHECLAQCCKGPLILSLTSKEKQLFISKANDNHKSIHITDQKSGGWLKFEDHDGHCCPMLDLVTNKCLIYDERPHRCRKFPEKPVEGCAISSD
jgi:Fe-S-cluster containining protein